MLSGFRWLIHLNVAYTLGIMSVILGYEVNELSECDSVTTPVV
jgi:hypothetical protein